LQNQPLSSGDHSKIVIFILLFLPSIGFLVGVIPAILLIFGIFMMKKNEDFNHIKTAVKICRGYIFVCVLISFGFGVYHGYLYIITESTKDMGFWDAGEKEWHEKMFYFWLLLILIPILYLVFISKLFFNPLSQHKKWVEVNGIFSTKPKSGKDSNNQSEVNIIKGEKLKQYSVADELIKWAKLKEGGHISDEEFNEARVKLLKRN
jgi:hypothetical protein